MFFRMDPAHTLTLQTPRAGLAGKPLNLIHVSLFNTFSNKTPTNWVRLNSFSPHKHVFHYLMKEVYMVGQLRLHPIQATRHG